MWEMMLHVNSGRIKSIQWISFPPLVQVNKETFHKLIFSPSCAHDRQDQTTYELILTCYKIMVFLTTLAATSLAALPLAPWHSEWLSLWQAYLSPGWDLVSHASVDRSACYGGRVDRCTALSSFGSSTNNTHLQERTQLHQTIQEIKGNMVKSGRWGLHLV